MTGWTHTIRRLVTAIALALTVAALAVPSALAAGGCPCNRDLPSPYTGAAAQTAALHQQVVRVIKPSGFDWGDFGIGVATAVGVLLALGGLGIGARQAQQARRLVRSV